MGLHYIIPYPAALLQPIHSHSTRTSRLLRRMLPSAGSGLTLAMHRSTLRLIYSNRRSSSCRNSSALPPPPLRSSQASRLLHPAPLPPPRVATPSKGRHFNLSPHPGLLPLPPTRPTRAISLVDAFAPRVGRRQAAIPPPRVASRSSRHFALPTSTRQQATRSSAGRRGTTPTRRCGDGPGGAGSASRSSAP